MAVQYTLCLIKPAAVMAGNAPDIQARLLIEGFSILRTKETTMSVDEVRAFFAQHKSHSLFETAFIPAMTEGPSVIMLLSRDNAISRLCQLMKEADEMSGRSWTTEGNRDIITDLLHAPETAVSAAKEILFHFPDMGCEEEAPKARDVLYIPQVLEVF